MRLHFDPPFLPLHAAVIAVVAAGALVALFQWEVRRQRGKLDRLAMILRSAVVALLVLILLNPTYSVPAPQANTRAPFFILLDTSRSMAIADAGENGASLSRWTAAKRAALENRSLLDALRQRCDVRVYGFDVSAHAQSVEELQQVKSPDGSATAIGEVLTQVLSPLSPSPDIQPPIPISGGALILSDGRDNGTVYPPDAARMARSRGLPVYTVCVGKEVRERDLQVFARRPQIFSAPGQTVEITATLDDVGIDGAETRVDLLKEGSRVASRNVVVHPGRQEVMFSVIEPNKGFYRYALACSVLPGESSEANNRASVFLNVMETRARVLFLEGRPSWDSKFLVEALRSDPTVTLDVLYKITADRPFALSSQPGNPILTAPRALADFQRYDVLILGKGYEEFFGEDGTKVLKQWVGDHGGNIIFLRGRADERSESLHELEPVAFTNEEVEEARVRLTEAGRAHPGFAFTLKEDAQTVVQKLPSLITATRVQGEKALAVVLARAPGVAESSESGDTAQEMALLAYQRYGQGKTLAVAGQGLWRWAFPPPELEAYGQVYNEFWTQTVRWLVSESDFLPGQNLALRTDKTSYALKDIVNFLGYLRGQKTAALPVIAITQPDGKTATVAASAADGKAADFAAAFRPTLPGEYVATVSPLSGNPQAAPAVAAFTVYAGQKEDANRSADPVLMRQIAEAGGGEMLRLDELPNLPEKLRAAAQAASQTQEPRTAWDRGWILALLIGLLSAEWLLRRRAALKKISRK